MVIDSGILIDWTRDNTAAREFLSPLVDHRVCLLHPVVHAELLVGCAGPREMRAFDEGLSRWPRAVVRSADLSVCLDLVRRYRPSHGLGWPDALIAATCLRLALPIATINDRHFRPIAGLRVVRPY